MKRKINLLLCVIIAVSLLAACGISNDKTPIKIGYFGPLTGPSAQLGQAAKNGAQIAIDEINKKGGVLGKELTMVEYDDKSSPEQAVRAATKLVQVDKVTAIFGSLHSGNVLAAAPVVEAAHTVTVSGGTSPTWLEQGYTYLFRAVSNTNVSMIQLSKYAQSKSFNKIAIFTSNDEYGVTGGKNFGAAATALGIKIVANETFTHGDRDFTGQFAKIKDAKPDAVLVWALSDDLGAVTKQLRQAGLNQPILGSESYTLPEIINIAGDAANGVVFAAQFLVYENPEDAPDPLMQDFLKRYKAKYNENPKSDNAFRAYDGVMMLAKAITDAKSTEGPKIRDAYNNIDGYTGLAGTFSYKGKHGEGIDKMRIFEVVDKKYVEAK